VHRITFVLALATGLAPVTQGASVGTVRWVHELSDSTSYFAGGPAISPEGNIYIGSQNRYLYSFDSSGKINWSTKLIGGIHTPPTIGPDGTVYVGCWNGGLFAFSPEGKAKWEFPARADWQRTAQLSENTGISVGASGTIYFISENAGKGKRSGQLVAVNPDGTQRWSSPIAPSRFGRPGIRPVVTKDSIILLTRPPSREAPSLVSLDLEGNRRWERIGITTDIAIGSDGSIFAGGTNSQLVALGPGGETRWTTHIIGGVTAAPVIDRLGVVYVGTSDGYLAAVSSSGKPLWVAETGGGVGYCGNMSEGELQSLKLRQAELMRPEHPRITFSAALDEAGNIVVANASGMMAFTSSGKRLWEAAAGGGAPAIGTDGTVFAISQGPDSRGRLIAVQGAAPLQKSPWPMFGQNARHTSSAE